MSDLKNRLRVLRAEKDLTQEALAKAVGISRQTIVAIEKGNYHPSVKLSLEIAAFFEVKLEDVFSLGD